MKQPLVLLHGWGVNRQVWNPILPELENHFELTRIDLPGYGNDTGYAGEYSMDSIVQEVLARAPKKSNWVAWSLGATIAIEAAITYPERFLKLQLVSPTPRFLKSDDWDRGVDIAAFRALADDFERDYAKAVQRFLLLQVHSDDRARFKKTRPMIRSLADAIHQLPRPTDRTIGASLQLLGDSDLRVQLEKLNLDIQVIAGKNDRIVPVTASEHLYSNLVNGDSIHLFDTGHLAFLEEPTKYIEALTRFLSPDS